MRRTLFAIGLLLAMNLGAQEARVLELSRGDAYDVKQAWLNLQEAQGRWDGVQTRVKEKYLRVPYGDKEAGSEISAFNTSTVLSGSSFFYSLGHEPTPEERANLVIVEQEAARERVDRRRHAMYERKGWESGFQFTSDFRFIVPKSTATTPTQCWGGTFGGCGLTITH